VYIATWAKQTLLTLGLGGTVLFAVGFDYSDAGYPGRSSLAQRAAYSRLDGIIGSVSVTTGSRVRCGDVVARLDSFELDYQIEAQRAQMAIVAEERQSALDAVAGGMLIRIAESRQLALKLRALELDLRHLLVKRSHLDIRAPADGVIISPDPTGLVGSRATAGSPVLHIGTTQRPANS
jgi:multidrug resistance efflux pump